MQIIRQGQAKCPEKQKTSHPPHTCGQWGEKLIPRARLEQPFLTCTKQLAAPSPLLAKATSAAVQQWLRLKSSCGIAHGEERAHGVLLHCCSNTSNQYWARRLSAALRAEQLISSRASPRGLTLHEKKGWFHTESLQSQRMMVHHHHLAPYVGLVLA